MEAACWGLVLTEIKYVDPPPWRTLRGLDRLNSFPFIAGVSRSLKLLLPQPRLSPIEEVVASSRALLSTPHFLTTPPPVLRLKFKSFLDGCWLRIVETVVCSFSGRGRFRGQSIKSIPTSSHTSSIPCDARSLKPSPTFITSRSSRFETPAPSATLHVDVRHASCLHDTSCNLPSSWTTC